MIPLTELWLPILVSAVFVFVASSIIHMALPIHKNDCGMIPGEDKVRELMRNQGVQPGTYAIPRADSMKDMGSSEMIEKYNQGPVAMLTVMPNGAPAIGKSLVLWFIYSVVLSVFAGYVAAIGLGAGADYLAVFRVTGAVSLLGYSVSYLPDVIWKGQPWSNTLKFMFDGAVYGLVTAGTFGWLWPAAA